jgi:hypothetical protein
MSTNEKLKTIRAQVYAALHDDPEMYETELEAAVEGLDDLIAKWSAEPVITEMIDNAVRFFRATEGFYRAARALYNAETNRVSGVVDDTDRTNEQNVKDRQREQGRAETAPSGDRASHKT